MIGGLVAVCVTLVVHDGDGFRCNGVKVRLAAVDAPEMRGSPACVGWKRKYHNCDFVAGEQSRRVMVELTSGRTLHGRDVGDGGFQRTAVRCNVGGVDLGCAMIARGAAIERYGRAGCARQGSEFRATQHSGAARLARPRMADFRRFHEVGPRIAKSDRSGPASDS